MNNNQNTWKVAIVGLLGIVYFVLVFTYVFLDDGGVQIKTLLDFVFIPIVSFLISLVITTLISIVGFLVRKCLVAILTSQDSS